MILKPSIGEFGDRRSSPDATSGPGAVPSLTLSGEHYNMIARMLREEHPGQAARQRPDRSSTTRTAATPTTSSPNCPATDPLLRDEVVMLGAHLDSWHTGVGATDNADGVDDDGRGDADPEGGGRAAAAARFASRIWGGEEQGLLGSSAWVAEHLAGDANRAARDKFNVYFNIDNGYRPDLRLVRRRTASRRPIFDRWLEPLKAIGARRNAIEGGRVNRSSELHRSWRAGFNPIRGVTTTTSTTHHTNMDTPRR